MSSPRRRRPARGWLAAAAAVVLGASTAAAAFADGGGGGPAQVRAFALPELYADHQLATLTANPDCTLTVPARPLSAEGLATPYVLGSAGQDCAENQNLGAFVQAVILNPATGALSVYDPEVVTAGQAPPVVPPVPHLPSGAVVAIWTGFNGNQLKLEGSGAGYFVNFAQQSYADSPQFFAALRRAVREGLVKVPAIGTGSDGLACPTSRDFSIVDQDQSDNVPVTYTYDGGASNGSDEQLLNLVQASLGCAEWKVPLLDPAVAVGNGNGTSTAGILQEEQASVYQQAPVALVPGNDEFTTNNGNFVAPNGNGVPDLFLQDLYRDQVGQPLTFNGNDTAAYCQNLANTGAVRLGKDAAIEAGSLPPVFAEIGTNLANVLAGRFVASYQLLNCQGLTGQPSPIAVTVDPNSGLITSATYPGGTAPVTPPTTTPPVTTPPTTAPPTTPPATAPAGTLAFVQESSSIASANPVVAGEGPLNSDGAGAASPVLASPVRAGDLLVMWGTVNDSNGGSNPLSLTGNTAGWKLAGQAGGPFNWTALWYQAGATAGETLPQVTDLTGGNGVSSDYLDTQAAEFSGAGALDQSGSGTVPSGTAVAAGGADRASDLVVAVSTWNGANLNPAESLALSGASGQALSASVSSGAESADEAGGSPFYAFGYALGSGTGTQADTVTAATSSFENDGAAVIASFSPAG
jgi:hypothetical protein